MSIKCGIYKITNKINNKVYIGQSINIESRWTIEKSRSKNPATVNDSILYQSLNKYGIDNFLFEVIEECSENQLNEREQYWIDYYNSMTPNGYNMIAVDQTLKHDVNRCVDCGCIINKNATRCVQCSHINQRLVERPDENQLIQDITLLGFEGTARKYGLASGKSIKKWCINYGLPTKINDYKTPKEKKPHKTVLQIDLNTNEIINEFQSAADAARFLNKNSNSHIVEACNNKLPQAYGYKWQYKF